ncbi:MAG: Tol-Pal system beta propeller repeat protein TolB [Deltaproteobacteria bacterium]|nr:Tol-Pal system beta propeller repeat protein TolB [Deltaproteobacteria bacterium]MBW2144045.1 Tol-Pal system beta propeller repeat protein TolB [Deltaproteobacteria bacterium]
MLSKSGPSFGTSAPYLVLLALVIHSLVLLFFPGRSLGRIYIDINAPSIQKFRIAIPDTKNLTQQNRHQELATKLTAVISNDLDCSGYFSRIGKEAFLVGEEDTLTPGNIRFKDWSVIGAELLLYTSYTCIGNSLEVEIRLFDVFSGRQILGKRALGDIKNYRYLVHRLSNEIILTLTGHAGIFLTRMVFISDTSGHKEIYVCDYDGHNVRQVTRDKILAILPRLSPDGKKVAYTSYKEGGPMLYLKDIASGSVKRLSGRSGLNSGVSWAPGGRTLAMTMSRKGNPDIYRVDLNGKILKRLTTYWGIDVSPSFSPDGKRLAFVSDRSGSPQIYVLDPASGKTERLTFNGTYNTSPSWSRLNRIAFVSRNNGNLDIFSMDANGGGLRRLTENQGKNEGPCWSPDGRYIVFSAKRDGSYSLYMMNANGKNHRKISLFSGNHTSPSWAP